MGVQAGKRFEVRVLKNSHVPFTYRSAGDTLIVRYEPAFYPGRIAPDEAFTSVPFAYIIAPGIQTILVTGAICELAGLTTDKLTITATNARVLISQSTIGNLTTTGTSGSLLQTASANQIRTATITSYDSTAFVAEQDVFGSVVLQHDSTATIKVPAVLLKKISN
ncbi:hypothetical protein GCM10023187_06310 [Nibrella viscosa]|uniref:Uncharacterized protein n=2 Tax=Nibrella viscosa TaxID=1084524 RepID=A0ABP8JXG8_9BACT